MKLLHTSDWHLGRTTYGETRAPDHDAVIAEIIELARQVQPDLVCHTGDLFDHRRPSSDDLARAADALTELAAVAPVVIVCGNHDSARLFHALNQFSGLSGSGGRLRFVDRIQSPISEGILRFPTSRGDTIRLAAVPFQPVNNLVDPSTDPVTWGSEYTAQVRNVENALGDALTHGLDPTREFAVFAAHLHVGGAAFCGSERAAHISDTYSTDLDAIPPVSYAAFGHLHKPQPLPGKKVTGRYAGSPIQLDFGEVGEHKSVTVVEAMPGEPASVEVVELNAGRRLRAFRGTLEELEAVASTVGDDLCLITVHVPTHIPTLSEQVSALLPQATILQINADIADRRVEVVPADAISEDAEPDLSEMFEEFLAQRGTRLAPAKAVMATFSTILSATNEDRDPAFAEEEILAKPIPELPTREARA